MNNNCIQQHPLITVITAAKNAEQTLERCLISVQNQTYTNTEHIIVLGSSQDATQQILNNHIATNLKLKVLPTQVEGIYSALNEGIKSALGEYILILGADDWLEPNGLSLLIHAIYKHKADFAVGWANLVTNSKNELISTKNIRKINNFDFRILTGGMPFCHQAMLASKKCYDICGLYDETLSLSSDYKWVKQLFLSKQKICTTQNVVVNFNTQGSSINKKKWMWEHKKLLAESYCMSSQHAMKLLNYFYDEEEIDINQLYTIACETNNIELLKSIFGNTLEKVCKIYNVQLINKIHANHTT